VTGAVFLPEHSSTPPGNRRGEIVGQVVPPLLPLGWPAENTGFENHPSPIYNAKRMTTETSTMESTITASRFPPASGGAGKSANSPVARGVQKRKRRSVVGQTGFSGLHQ
jgi:hypothetical protein